MNASLARRIRYAESLLIYAIDRQYAEQRDRSHSGSTKNPRDPIPGGRPERGPEGWKPETGREIRVLRC